MWRLVLLVPLLVGCTPSDRAPSATPSSAQGECEKDFDCKDNRVCDKGRCIEPAEAAATAK